MPFGRASLTHRGNKDFLPKDDAFEMEFGNSGVDPQLRGHHGVGLEDLSDNGEIIQWQPTEELEQEGDSVLKEIREGLQVLPSPIKKQGPEIEVEEVQCESLCEFEFISQTSNEGLGRESEIVFEEGVIKSDSIMSIRCSPRNFENFQKK